MLQNLQAFQEFCRERDEFSRANFGTPAERGPTGPLMHLKEEIDEVLKEPNDEMEWADCWLLFLDAVHRKGYTLDQLTQFARKKLEINKARKWEKRADGTYRHVKEQIENMVIGANMPPEGELDMGKNIYNGEFFSVKRLHECPKCRGVAFDGVLCHYCGIIEDPVFNSEKIGELTQKLKSAGERLRELLEKGTREELERGNVVQNALNNALKLE